VAVAALVIGQLTLPLVDQVMVAQAVVAMVLQDTLQLIIVMVEWPLLELPILVQAEAEEVETGDHMIDVNLVLVDLD
tara:strand:- start:133 stop:363 length:231 start_codon:yes stop_codon:yes gene_type:complete